MRYGIIGSSGRMGRELAAQFSGAGYELVLTADAAGENIQGQPQVIVDFSLPPALTSTLRYCRNYGAALVLGTTGFSDEQLTEINKLSKEVPVVHSANFGIGVNLLAMILQDYSDMLSDWDLEIEEAHHNKKKDAPSGTAVMLMKAAGRDCPTHSLRLGNLPGDHTVHFALGDEMLSFTHRAINRAMFATGALRAAEFAVGAQAGYYNFQDVLRLRQVD